LDAGCQRLRFIGRHDAAPACVARSRGFRDALVDAGLAADPERLYHIDPEDLAGLERIAGDPELDGIVCSNDYMAARVMRILEGLSRRVPHDVKVAGFDDVKYASLVSVPLTTVRQPCADLGETAMRVMVERLRNPSMPARDVFLDFRLIVRASCSGAHETVASSSVGHAAVATI